MPQKLNKGGKLQNYIPAGHGDPSGEYGDNATGSNRHIQFDPDDENDYVLKDDNVVAKEPESQTYDKEAHYQENVEKLKNINQEIKQITDSVEEDRYNFMYNRLSKEIIEVEPEDLHYTGWGIYGKYENASTTIDYANIKVLEGENRKKAFDLYLQESATSFNLPSFSNDDDYSSLLANNDLGYERMFKFLGNPVVDKDYGAVRYLKKIYAYEINEYNKKIREIIDPEREKQGKEYIENNFSKIQGEHTIEDDIEKVNLENYKKDQSYHINCQRCSFAYELRRRGYDVSALPNDDSYGTADRWVNQMIFKDEYDIKAANYLGMKKQVESIVSKAGNGSRFAIDCFWKGYGGHVFLVENINGEVRFMDAQTGKVDATEGLARINAKAGVGLRRMDNAVFTGSVKKTAITNNPKKEEEDFEKKYINPDKLEEYRKFKENN